MNLENAASIATIAASVITCGGFLIYVGRSLGTLDSIKTGVEVALRKVDGHDKEISDIKVELAQVKTRQADCGNCV